MESTNKASMTKAEIKAKLAAAIYGTDSAQWVYRALVAIYHLQTPTEKVAAMTEEHNGQGFNSADAEFLTDLALRTIQNGVLSCRQFDCAKRKIQKYAGQLEKLAAQRNAVKVVAE